MKRTRLSAKRPGKRRTVHSVPMLRTVLCYRGEELELKPARKGDGGLSNTIVRQTRKGTASVNLRRLAKGRECQVRIFGRCSYDADTTVLAHFRLLPFNGAGMKPADWLGAWACSACHDFVDHRSSSLFMSTTDRRLAFAEGVFRTFAKLIEEGYITVGNKI